MHIKRLVIENFKSIERIELIEPNPFTVFVGPNGSGKSNIFEALEFVVKCSKFTPQEAIRQTGGRTKVINRKIGITRPFLYNAEFDPYPDNAILRLNFNPEVGWVSESKLLPLDGDHEKKFSLIQPNLTEQFFLRFDRLFIKNISLQKIDYQDDSSLNLAATNLEKVLKRILADQSLRDEIFEWLALFIPGFKTIEIDDRDELHWFEEFQADYFTKDLISDGTYNILALLTAVYQSDDPQFLCIEEPENGLHPQVLMSLVDFFRHQCQEKGHYIWLNTHSESLVRKLQPEEIILVDKREGATQTRQIKGRNVYDIPTDEAWLTGALGGGLPW